MIPGTRKFFHCKKTQNFKCKMTINQNQNKSSLETSSKTKDLSSYKFLESFIKVLIKIQASIILIKFKIVKGFMKLMQLKVKHSTTRMMDSIPSLVCIIIHKAKIFKPTVCIALQFVSRTHFSDGDSKATLLSRLCLGK